MITIIIISELSVHVRLRVSARWFAIGSFQTFYQGCLTSVVCFASVFLCQGRLVSETVRRRPAQVHLWLGPMSRTKTSLTCFARHSPHLYRVSKSATFCLDF